MILVHAIYQLVILISKILTPSGESKSNHLKNIPNPALVYCEDQGYELKIRTEPEVNMVFAFFQTGQNVRDGLFMKENADLVYILMELL